MTKYLLPLLIIATLFRLVLSTSIYSGDLNNHFKWGESILINGFNGAYDREYVGVMQPTYPPLSLYAFTTSTGMYKLVHSASWYLNNHFSLFPSQLIWLIEDQDVLPAFNKVITIASDIGIGLLIYIFVRKLKPTNSPLALFASIGYLFNPAVWYTSSLWGQIESFPIFFILLSYFLMYKNQGILSHLSFVAALLSKQSSIIFIPIHLLLSISKLGFKTTFKGVLVQLFTFYILFMPFYNSLNPIKPITTYVNRIQTGSGSNWVTDHAFNPWVWLTKLEKIPDTTPAVGNISAQAVGFVLFAISIGLTMLIYLQKSKTPQLTFFASALVTMLSFLLLTKMHERYLAPVLPFLVLGAALSSSWIWVVYIGVSFVHLANLYHNWWFPRIPQVVTWLSLSTTIDLLIVTLVLSTIVTVVQYVRHS